MGGIRLAPTGGSGVLTGGLMPPADETGGPVPPADESVSYGSTQEENIEIAPQYASCARQPETGRLFRVPELRRAQASPPCVRCVWPL